MALETLDPKNLQAEAGDLYTNWSEAYTQLCQTEQPLLQSIANLKLKTKTVAEAITDKPQPDITHLWLLTTTHSTQPEPEDSPPTPQPAYTHHSLIIRPNPKDKPPHGTQALLLSTAFNQIIYYNPSNLYMGEGIDNTIPLPLFNNQSAPPEDVEIKLKHHLDSTSCPPIYLIHYQSSKPIKVKTSLGETLVDASALEITLDYADEAFDARYFDHQRAGSRTQNLHLAADQLNGLITDPDFPLTLAINQANQILDNIQTIQNPPKPPLFKRIFSSKKS